MLKATSKEAIKAALAVVCSLCLAIGFQWEKPYWAAITVAVMALDETFAHALQKGQNRIIGALLGVGYALFLIVFFSQERFLFFAFYSLFLAASLFMASDKKYGYIFIQGFCVCTIVCCMGGFDNTNTFQTIVLRLQETMLGIVVFSLIYKVLWPVTTQSIFVGKYEALRHALSEAIDKLQNGQLPQDEISRLQQDTTSLNHLLALPNSGSYDLQFYQSQWLNRIHEMHVIIRLLDSARHTASELTCYLDEIQQKLMQAESNDPTQALLPQALIERTQPYATHPSFSYSRSVKQHLKEDGMKVVQGVFTFVVAIMIWIYLPVPGGFVFPMLAGVIAANVPLLLSSMIKDAFWATISLGGFYLAQFVFIMPGFTELWQLACFYFINVVAIWKIFDTPRLGIYKVLGVNLLLVLTSGALNLTPRFDIVMPMSMMTYIVMVLMIAKICADVFQPNILDTQANMPASNKATASH
ncbi:FUSC family protein [Shewanella seohaensis]|uniref:FUSC family protein n=1 Tax=Shewanella seohaensis TaxID=755175 RepID=UPI00200C00D5|nr:FUSC family protein [Shewanella seohaensis]MCL1122549.1 FUSC family protein [Shewanella seohaensis]